MTLREAQRRVRIAKAMEEAKVTAREWLDTKMYPLIARATASGKSRCFIAPNVYNWDEAKAELEAKGFGIKFIGNGNFEFIISW